MSPSDRDLAEPLTMSAASPLAPLPSETVVQILTFLDLATISAVVRLNSSWLALVLSSRQAIYRALAVHHRLAEPGLDLHGIIAQDRTLRGCETWYELCTSRSLSIESPRLSRR